MNNFTHTHSFLAITGLISLILLYGSCRASKKSSNHGLAIGNNAPDFSLVDDNNRTQTLSHMPGSRIAIYFYPKDQTPGCTAQACSIADSLDALRDQNIHVWGISYDSPASHAAFKQKYHLTFPLLSDSDKKVATLYGVKGLLFAKRITFLVDEQGVIVAIIKDIDVKNHAQQILKGFAATK